MTVPRVSVVLPCRNEVHHIVDCLKSALAQEPVDGEMEIIVADGMSDDGTRELIEGLRREHPNLVMIDNPNRIVPTGLNRAISVARGEVIVRFDAHTEYAPDYVRRCVEVLDRTGADNVGGPARTRTTGYMQEAIAAAYHSKFSTGGAAFHDPTFEGYVDTVTYGCWRKSLFEQVGFFDEELVRNQDDEHNLRINRAGGKVYQSPDIKSWYYPRASLSALFKQYMQYGYWKVRVIQKHRLPASIRQLVPGAFVVTLAGLTAGSLVSSLARLGLATTLASYAATLSVASLKTAKQTDWKLLPVLPLAFATFHLGYGLGFAQGALDFVVLRRSPRSTFTLLTRSV